MARTTTDRYQRRLASAHQALFWAHQAAVEENLDSEGEDLYAALQHVAHMLEDATNGVRPRRKYDGPAEGPRTTVRN